MASRAVRLALAGVFAFIVAWTLADAAVAAARRQPYDVPRLTPRSEPGAMSRSEPWKLKEPNAYAIRQPAYPYASKRSREHVASQVRAYNRSFTGYAPPKSPRMKRQPRIGGRCYMSSCQ